jgi:hypothetical protein
MIEGSPQEARRRERTKGNNQDAAYRRGTPSESGMSPAAMNPSRRQRKVNVKMLANGRREYEGGNRLDETESL